MEYSQEKFTDKLGKIPLSIPFFTSLIAIYGFVVLYSAAGGQFQPWAYKQFIIFCLFMPIALVISMIDMKYIFRFAYIPYLLVIILLLIVELFGKKAMGATRWLDLGLFHVQPSEPAKLAVVLMLARYFHKTPDDDLNRLHFIILPAIAVVIPTALIIKQPDLGTGIITLLVVGIMFFAAGIKILYFVIAGILAIISVPLLWFMLYSYQQNRLLIFFNPEREPLGAGYNIIQSKIAIGSGGLFGKGLLAGTQSHLSFLPEYETDFIFSFLAEELGFIGGIVLLLLYLLLIVSCLLVAVNCKTKFARLVVVGITSIFFSHVFINIAMVMGMLPTVGVPLPLISYGGTMMVSMLIGFGIIMNIGVNQQKVV